MIDRALQIGFQLFEAKHIEEMKTRSSKWAARYFFFRVFKCFQMASACYILND